jgi:hypothetical protein
MHAANSELSARLQHENNKDKSTAQQIKDLAQGNRPPSGCSAGKGLIRLINQTGW